jgi:hypothetical protein
MSLSRRVLISTIALAFTLVAVPAAATATAAQSRVTAGVIFTDGLPHCCVGGGNPPGSGSD